MTKVAVGFSVHTGWAAMVAVGGVRQAQVLVRERVALIASERFVYHAAAQLAPVAADKLVSAAVKEAQQAAAKVLKQLRDQHDLVGCAVVAGPATPPDDLAAIVRSHPAIHTAEGALYRDAIMAAAGQLRLPAELFPPKTLPSDGGEIAEAGRGIGPPWGKDQRLAALAAWRLLRAR